MAQYVKMTWQNTEELWQEANVPMKSVIDTINNTVNQMQKKNN